MLDIGCGEGYYIYVFVDVLFEIIMFGLDVLKVVIKVVVKCYLQVIFCVVFSYCLLFFDISMDVIICIYVLCKVEELV